MDGKKWVTLKDGRRILINDYMNNQIRSKALKQKEYKIPKDIIINTYERRGYPNNENFADFYLTSIEPDEFLKLTTNSATYSDIFEQNEMWGRKLDLSKINSTYMYLEIDMKTGKVMQHEGRHRMALLKNNGYKKAEIFIFPYYGTSDRYNPQSYTNKTLLNQTGTDYTSTISKITPLTRGEIEKIKKERRN